MTRDTDLNEGGQNHRHLPPYVASWLSDGYLERRFPPDATEEEYELSTATVEAICFLSAIAEPHSVATESRLSLVIQALVGLAEDTDTDKHRWIDRLMAEQARAVRRRPGGRAPSLFGHFGAVLT